MLDLVLTFNFDYKYFGMQPTLEGGEFSQGKDFSQGAIFAGIVFGGEFSGENLRWGKHRRKKGLVLISYS
jgi:hypothetical protein